MLCGRIIIGDDMKKSHIKLKYKRRLGALFISMILFIFVFSLFKNRSEKFEPIVKNHDYGDYITDKYEQDSNEVKEYFAKGMDASFYKDILDRESNYVSSNCKYSNISYNFNSKLHYSDIEDYLNLMNCSDIVKLEVIGKSVDNRNIYGIEIGNGEKTLFIDANIHAAEVGNTPVLIQFLSDILNKYENNDNSIKALLNNLKIVVIPTINPDGYEVYNFGINSLNNKDLWIYQNRNNINFENLKSNANGVDINRNFPTQNAGLYYKSKKLISSVSFDKTYKGLTYFGGYSLGSEPETRAAMYFMLKHYKNTYAYINLHSQGRVIYAGKPNLSSEFNKLCNNFAKKISKINGYIVHGLSSEEVGEGNDGSATDFMAELANGFKFSTKTGRLTSGDYMNTESSLVYKYPVVTIETLNTYTTNVSTFKNEYNNYKLKDVLYMFISNVNK